MRRAKRITGTKVTVASARQLMESLYLNKVNHIKFMSDLFKIMKKHGFASHSSFRQKAALFLNVNLNEVVYDFGYWSKTSIANADLVFQMLYFIGRGSELPTKRDQSTYTHILRGIKKFFKKAEDHSRIKDDTQITHKEMIYIEKDYIKLLNLTEVPQYMKDAWERASGIYGFIVLESGTKIYFK